ncbi:MAG: hypothetical protein ACRC6M_14315, partial [Microcystaceae cyanobacterium]
SSASSPVPSGPPVPSSKGGMDEPTEPIVPTPPSYNAPRSRSSNSGNAWEIFNPVQLLVRMTMVGCVLGGLGYGLYRLGTWQSPETAKSIVPQDFKETDNTDWQHPPNNQVKNGQLQHRLTVPATQLSVLKDQNLGDSTVKTETRFESKTANQAITGLATRINGKSDSNFYYLLIRADGAIALGKRNSSGWQNKVDWVKNAASAAVSSSEPKRLELNTQGDEITGMINGQKVGGFRDSEYKSGKVGLISRQDTMGKNNITFDNVMVMATQGDRGTFSPEQTLMNYYNSFLSQPGVENLDLLDRVEVYNKKRLKTDYHETLLKVGVRYTFKNGSSFCETRLISFHFDEKQKEWIAHKPKGITLQPRCKL